jgi:tRNA/tmRNA/rRNA uracil-C5-methylase (TrmA/RlmC/RlmD family)
MRVHVGAQSTAQVNNGGAEVICNQLKAWCASAADAVLLDICCGGGILGLSLASEVEQVVGIELVQAAIDDAKV